MGNPRYRLQTVLELRERERDAAQEALAQRIADEAREREVLAGLEAELAAAEAELAARRDAIYEPEAAGTLAISTIDRRRAEVKFLEGAQQRRREGVQRQHEAVAAAVAAVTAAREALVAAAQALTAIEKHRDKWREGVLAEERRKEEQLIGEIAAANFAAARREGEGR
jgi:flagellar export protein FliJ